MTFSSPIGKQIGVDVHSLEVTISPTIPSADLPHFTPDVGQDLSSDVKLLYRCAKVITTGETAAVAHLWQGRLWPVK